MRNMYQMSQEEVLESVHSRQEGLKKPEAARLLEENGYNQITEGERKSLLVIFLQQFKDFLVLILICAAAISGFLGDLESTIVILLVITMNAVLGTIQHVKAEKSLDSLKQLSAPHAKVYRDGEIAVIPSREVVVGDVILVEAGDFVCADGRMLKSASLKTDESALTGESLAVEKKENKIDREVPLGDRVNMVFSGSFVAYGRGHFVVTETGMDTEVGKIAALLRNTKEHKTPLQQNLDLFGRRISVIILAVCALLFIMSMIRGESVMNAFLFAVALAVAAIPEALSSIVTIVLAFGTQKMSKEHAIIRKLQAVEGLGSVSIICSDKTGTLTQNKMTIIDVFVNQAGKKVNSLDTQNQLERRLLTCSVLCNDASVQGDEEIGDPTELAFISMADGLSDPYCRTDPIRETYQRLSEVPFDSDRKLMSTLHRLDGELIMITKGAVDVLLDRVVQIRDDSGIRNIEAADKERIAKANQSYSEQGLRVLAVAEKKVSGEQISTEDESALTFLGMFSMMDPPREESKTAVAECVMAGIRPIMITGDHKVTASAIAEQIGILTKGTRSALGSEIDCLSEEELREFVKDVSVYARVSPEHKIRIVNAWQQRGNIVAMTGDGVNDAPALKQADVGVAMGITGTEVAKDAASMVLTDDNFATIVKAVENGRNVYQNIKKSIRFLLSGNTAGILAVVITFLAGTSVPFAPVHLLFINLLTDSLPAIALGLDPHTSQVMNEKPRKKDEAILNITFVRRTVTEGAVIALTTIAAYFIGLSQGGAATASTMAFATLCLSRLFHGFNCKSDLPVLFTKEFGNNKFMWLAFAAGLFLLSLVLFIPALHPIFAVTPLSMNLLAWILGLSVSNLFIIQTIKLLEKLIMQRVKR